VTFAAGAAHAAIEVEIPTIKAKNRLKEYKKATLTLDDSARRLVLASRARAPALALSYESVARVIVEPDVRIEYSAAAALAGFALGGPLFGPAAAASISNPAKSAHSVYLEYRGPDGSPASFVFSIGEKEAPAALPQLGRALGERVALVSFGETPERLEAGKFRRHAEVYGVRGDSARHPLPEPRPDRALVVVACPAEAMVSSLDKFARVAVHLEVNDRVVAVNGGGTYTWFHLDPGEVLLVSHPLKEKEASGLRWSAETGGEYYLIQTFYVAGNFRSFLTRQSKELVMHEIRDLYWAEWKILE
jgi:hypothetical protein